MKEIPCLSRVCKKYYLRTQWRIETNAAAKGLLHRSFIFMSVALFFIVKKVEYHKIYYLLDIEKETVTIIAITKF